MSVEELRLPMPWGHIAAKTWGSKKNKRILMVHGILDNAGTFDRLISLLPDGYYYVCIDLPGHGLSSHFPPGMPLDFLNYILSIRRVLDYLQWETCIYIGHSLGANFGSILCATYPERISKIICLDAFISRPLLNEQLIPQIRRVQDYTIRIKEEGTIAPRLSTEEEVMYKLMNLRENSLNVPAAAALMKRSVTKIGDKYKFNRDPRLNVGLLPLFNYEQHLTILDHVEIPMAIVFSTSTLALDKNKGLKPLLYDLASTKKWDIVTVEGNHDVHNNNPERVAPHVCRFLANIKSNL